ncbi:MAG: QueT transporter family protein [Candidatus Methylomirabilales bacterium]
MREILTMWRHTKMVVLVALTAAVYAAILIPLKGIPLIPGITEIRPANVVPVVFSLLFGPAAAWGAAFGNLIGDFFGTLGLGSLFGFIGNFFYGFVPYKLWGRMGPLSSGRSLEVRSARQIVEYLLAAFLASVACAAFISWGLELFGLVPFAVVGPIITLNNFLAAALIGPFLLWLMYPRAKRWDILWTEIMESEEISRPAHAWIGVSLMWVGGIAALVVGVLVSTGLYAGTTGVGVVAGISPFLALFLLGALLS